MIKDRKSERYGAIFRPQHVQIRAGILEREGGETHDKSGLTIVELGTIHEFGAPEANIPERSFIRAWFDESQKEIQAMMVGRFQIAMAGKATWEQVANQAAAWCAGSIQKRISKGIEPPLKQATIDRKGSSKPLIDTGVLRSSISAEAVIA